VIRRVEAAPAWLRPGLYGASFVYLFIVQRGGLVVLPILLVIVAATRPRELLVVLPALFIVAPAAGFVGGLFYGVTGLLVSRLGRTGRVLQFIAATWVYCVLLVFVIMPWIEPGSTSDLPTGVNWAIATGMGVLFGTVLGVSATK
jgi:hypothetical protein